MAPLVNADKLSHLFVVIVIGQHTVLPPPNSIMDQMSFKIDIFITKVQLEQGLLPYCNLQVKTWRVEFPCIPMRNLGYILDSSCSLMNDTP